MNRNNITEIGDTTQKNLKQDCSSNNFDFTHSKRYFRIKTNVSESTIELKRQITINPLIYRKELAFIDQKNLITRAKQSLQSETEKLKNHIQQNLKLPKKNNCLSNNLDKIAHKIKDNQDQFTKQKSSLLKQLLLMNQSNRSKSNYTLPFKDNKKIQTFLQVRSNVNAESKLEEFQKRFQLQNQVDQRLRQRLASCLDKSQEKGQNKSNANFSGFIIQRKEIVNKNKYQVKPRLQQNNCNKEINTD